MKAAAEKTLEVLEWSKVLARLSASVHSPMGAALVEKLLPTSFAESTSEASAQSILELRNFLATGKSLPLSDLSDLQMVYKRITRGGAITVLEFAQIIRNQRCVLSLRAVLATMKGGAITRTLLQGLDPLEAWCAVHFSLIDQHGDIADSASDDLRGLRLLTRDLRSKIDEKLKNFLRDPHYGEILQDQYVTLRDGRYVIPVKTGFKGRMQGIIHDVSKTEATLFIEPEAVVELNNQLKVAEREIEIEIERILAEVVHRSKDVISFFEENQRLLAFADYLQAAAKFIAPWKDACLVERADDLCLEKLSHPLLSLETAVVPNTVEWKEALILSGPNTGGKTVLLKSVGLALLFARAGIPVCAASARVPAGLQHLYAEMGDDQNLFEKLSTFSAHMSSLREIFLAAKEGDVVLIDEIATGTGPEEGQALARALIESFLDKKIRIFVTTHYGALKIMALADERCRVASMAYDRQKRLPLYKVVMDVPGDSSALDAAERVGLAPEVLARARELLGEDSKDLDHAIKNLEKSRKKFEDKMHEIETERKTIRQKEKDLERLKELAEERLRKLTREEAKEELKAFRTLREDLAKKVQELQAGAKEVPVFEELAQAADKLRAFVKEDEPLALEKRGVDVAELKKAKVVEIAGLGLGSVEEDFTPGIGGRSMILVKVGEIKTRVSVDRLFEVAPEVRLRFEQGRKSWLKVEGRATSQQAAPSLQEKSQGSIVCDVRGRSWDEALRRIDTSLNQLTSGECSSVTIVHGHGKEILKDRIRNYLSKERKDFKTRNGSWPGEGGDGVTIVELA